MNQVLGIRREEYEILKCCEKTYMSYKNVIRKLFWLIKMMQWLTKMKWLLISEHTNRCKLYVAIVNVNVVNAYVVVVNINDSVLNQNEVVVNI